MRIGVVLLNWNSGELTLPCIESLLHGSRVPDSVVVVDNASSDGSSETIANRFPAVVVLRNVENLGFAGGNNVGIRHLLEKGSDFIWVLNNDTIVAPDCLQRLAEAMSADTGQDVASGKILYVNPADRIWYAGGHLSPWLMRGIPDGVNATDHGQHDAARDVDFVSGCSMFARRSAFEKVGLFHEQFFAYDEDVEWNFRAKAGGLRMRYIPGAVLRHHQTATVRKNCLGMEGGSQPARMHYLIARNRLFTIRLHAPSRTARACALLAYAAQAFRLFAGFLLRGRHEKLSALLQGIRDGWVTPIAACESLGKCSQVTSKCASAS